MVHTVMVFCGQDAFHGSSRRSRTVRISDQMANADVLPMA